MLYSKKVMSHFTKPHNVGEIKNPDGVGEVGNMKCGDIMHLYLKLNKKGIISKIKFRTTGCAAAIATSSIVTDLAKGMTIKQAMDMKNQDVIDALEGLPVVKIHCSILAVDALHEAIYDYYKKNKLEVPENVQKAHQRVRTCASHQH